MQIFFKIYPSSCKKYKKYEIANYKLYTSFFKNRSLG